MIPAPIPDDEPARLQGLRALNILDTAPEERFDRLTRLAKRLFGVPIALVSLVDENRQWFKSAVGLDVKETPRDISFCGHALFVDDILLIEDALLDERFHDNPLVLDDPKLRFYAGCPLKIPNGSKVGTLCLLDMEPRSLDATERELLHDLARIAEQEIAAVQLATMDELTQLSNRRGFRALGQHALGLCTRLDKPASLLFFDLDGFKSINDRHGHAEGDRALVTFGRLLLENFRDSDVVGRLGGDEFVVLMVNMTPAQSRIALDRLQRAVDDVNRNINRGYALRFSVGQVDFDPQRHRTVDLLLGEADERMYERKRAKEQAAQPASTNQADRQPETAQSASVTEPRHPPS
jgi:diguanylate cyclase (GGDEF)-like protein